MRRIVRLCCFVAFAAVCATVAPGADVPSDRSSADRGAVVQAMLDRSRLLADVHFTIPTTLWEMYVRESAAGEAPPLPAVSAEAVYAIELSAEAQAELTATVRYQVLDPASAGAIPALSAEYAWEDVRVNGEAADLPTADGWLQLVPTEPGEYIVEARSRPDWAAAISEYALDLPTVPTATTAVEFRSPGAWVVSADRAVGTIHGSIERGTIGRLPLRVGDRLNVTIQRPRPEGYHAPRYAVSGDMVWLLDAGGRGLTARLDVKVVTGRTDRIEVLLPAGASQVAVTGPDVRDLRVSGSSAVVFLRGELSEQTRLHLSCEVGGSQDTFRLGELGIRNGHFTGGTLVVGGSEGTSEVLPGRTTGLEPLAVSEIPASAAGMLGGAVAVAYRVTGRSWSAELEVIDLAEAEIRESLADLAHFQVVLTGDGTAFCKVNYELRNRTRQFMRVELPAGADMMMVRVNERAVPVTPTADGTWLVPLVRSTASVRGLVSFPVELVCIWRGQPVSGAASAAVPLPRIDLPIAYAWCELYVPDAMTVDRWAGPLERVGRFSSETAVASLTYGHGELAERPAGEQPVPPPATRPESAPEGELRDVQLKLGFNYYRTGRDYYDRGEYNRAADALRQAKRLNPEQTPAWQNASRLLDNIELLRGELKVDSKAEKAAAARVQSEAAVGMADLSDRQQELLEEGLEAARAGKSEEARAKLQVVEQIGDRLGMSGGGGAQAEQHARLSKARGELEGIEQRKQRDIAQMKDEVESLRRGGRYDEAISTARRLRSAEGDSGASSADEDNYTLQLAAEAAAKSAGPAQPTSLRSVVTREYDVRGLVRDHSPEELTETVRSVSGNVSFENGRLIVTDTQAGQHTVSELLGNLRDLSGPQVQMGRVITRQQAEGVLETRKPVDIPADDGVIFDDGLSSEFEGFYSSNYGWVQTNVTSGEADGDYREFVAKNLRLNWGQKLVVGSGNLDVTPDEAARVGAGFQRGRDGLTYAVLDEAQMRTLLELNARRDGQGRSDGRRRQETIVGTDVLLSNNMTANVAFAGDEYNELIIAGNELRVAHDEYLLIVNNGETTLVGAGEMQHWSEAVEQEVFAEVPQTIEPPRVGRMVGFEKSLIQPGDDLVLTAHEITWKGEK